MQTSAVRYENKINFTKWSFDRSGVFLEFIHSIMIWLKYKWINVSLFQNEENPERDLLLIISFWN